MVIRRIFLQARETPHKPAVVCNGVAVSYASFAGRIDASRRHFGARNLRAGSVAVLCIGRMPQAWIHCLALRSLGLITIAVRDPDEIGGLGLRDIGCVVAMEDGSVPAGVVDAAGWPLIRVPEAMDAAAAAHEAREIPESAAGRGGHIIMTSGTTGAQKMILRDAAADAATMPLHARINGISGASVVYVGDFPLWTAGGYRWPLIAWSEGATVVLQQGQDLRIPFGRPGLTHAFATPRTLAYLLSAPAGSLRRNDAMRLLVTGGALPRTLADEAKERLTRQVCTVFASTEALTLGVTPVDAPEDLVWHRIHPLREVQVVDESDRVLPAGELGQVRARILDGVAGYLHDEEASRAFFRGGYFYPGDLGVFRADGRLALCGRVTDIINILGDKIATGPVEGVLRDRLAVDEVCLFSLQGETGDEEVHLAIQSTRNDKWAELEAIARKSLNMFPGLHVHFVAGFPRNEMGKIQRFALKQQFLASRGPAGLPV